MNNAQTTPVKSTYAIAFYAILHAFMESGMFADDAYPYACAAAAAVVETERTGIAPSGF
jgi:hypothetical protein